MPYPTDTGEAVPELVGPLIRLIAAFGPSPRTAGGPERLPPPPADPGRGPEELSGSEPLTPQRATPRRTPGGVIRRTTDCGHVTVTPVRRTTDCGHVTVTPVRHGAGRPTAA